MMALDLIAKADEFEQLPSQLGPDKKPLWAHNLPLTMTLD
jgi:hypothetical protein